MHNGAVFILIFFIEINGIFDKNQYISGDLIVVLLITFTAGVITDCQGELTVNCDTCAWETIH